MLNNGDGTFTYTPAENFNGTDSFSYTVQDDGVAAYCDDRAWCLDTGAAEHYGGTVQVVEITPEGIRVLW